MSAYISKQTILFQHCDPARIVFFPRYFEMLNAVVEEWFDLGLGISFKQLHTDREEGIPSIRLEAEFMAPSRLGDQVDFALEVVRMGTSSAEFLVTATCDGELRLKIRQTVVHISNHAGKSTPWPDDMRQQMMRYMSEEE
jgi:4-hydroxybenzoyl-CoA thioesterase